MGGNTSCLDNVLTPVELERLKAETGFTSKHVRRLYIRFKHLDRAGKGYLDRDDLLFRLNELILNPVGEMIVDSLFDTASSPPISSSSSNAETLTMSSSVTGHNDRLYFKEFVRAFAVFRPCHSSTPENGVNSRSAKVRFLFNIADRSRNGFVSREDLQDLLMQLLGSTLSEDQVAMIASRVLVEADADEDGFLSFAEFEQATMNLDVEKEMSFLSLES